MKTKDRRKPKRAWPETQIRLSFSRVTVGQAEPGQARQYMLIEAEDHHGRITFRIRLSMEQYGQLIGGAGYQPVQCEWIAAQLVPEQPVGAGRGCRSMIG